MPGLGRVIANAREDSLQRVLARGCWSETEWFGVVAGGNGAPSGWSLQTHADDSFDVAYDGVLQGTVHWKLGGEHNRMNAVAAIAAARHVGVPAAQAIASLARFENVKRRMELRGQINGIAVYDDFAHHPTAISTTIEGLRKQVGAARILAVLEPRSNTMKLGTMKQALAGSLNAADLVFGFGARGGGKEALGWDLSAALAPLGDKAAAFDDIAMLVAAIVAAARLGDHILVMSNGGFDGVHQKILTALAARTAPIEPIGPTKRAT